MKARIRKAIAVAMVALALLAVPAPAFAELGVSAPLGEPNAGGEVLELGAPDPADVLLAAQAEAGTRERFVEVVLAQPTYTHDGIERWGENNNKYTRWYGLNDAWCGMFVDWCAREAGVSVDVIPTGIAGVWTIKDHFQWGPRWHDWNYRPQAGDLVIYSEAGTSDDAGHVGVVTGVDGGRFYTREGNRSDDYVVDDSWSFGTRWTGYGGNMAYIDGFVSPDFPEPPAPEPDFNFGPNVTLPAGDGTYTICSTLNKGLFLDGGGGSAEDGANAMLWPGDGDEPQRRWDFRRNDDGTYTIFRHGTNKVLDVNGISSDDGANVQIWESSGTDNQRWYVQDCGNGVYALKAKHSGKFLDATDAAPQNGANVQQWHGWATDAASHQKFIISPSYGPCVSLPKGGGPDGATYTVATALNPDVYVGAAGDGTANADNGELMKGANRPQCRWDFRRNEDGTYTVWRSGTSKVLGVSGITSDDGANVHLWEIVGGDNQRWWLEDCGDGAYALKSKHSGKFMDLSGGVAEPGTNVHQWRGNFGQAQRFRVEPWANDLAEAEVAPIAPRPWLGLVVEPRPEVRLNGAVLAEGTDYTLSWEGNAWPGTATVTATGVGDYIGSVSAEFEIVGYGADRWVDLPDGGKGYAKNGKLVTGWLDLGTSKFYFQPDGAMSTGWTDVEVGGKTLHYYFNPASGNLVRNTWFEIDGYKHYFRPSGNVAHGWATISDNGVDKKYYFDDDYRMVTGWADIANSQGQVIRYYFRPSGSMATGWATIDGQKYWFRDSGSMATGFTTVSDGSKRYFDAEGHMLVGWQDIGGKRYYFRDPSGAMQTGTATIGGATYEFTASGTLKSVAVPAQSEDAVELGAQAEEDGGEVAPPNGGDAGGLDGVPIEQEPSPAVAAGQALELVGVDPSKTVDTGMECK